MSVKAMAAVVAVAEGQHPVNVAGLCRDEGVSRKTFYKWVERYRQEGLEGLADRSRRPRSSPARTPVEVEDAVVRLRKELADGGLDAGALTIQSTLVGDGVAGVPSVATIQRILQRRGLVTPQPDKRPRSSWRRFEAPAPNEWWQIDHTDWATVAGPVKVFNVVDDHSRVLIRARVVEAATAEEAWTTFSQGAEVWGLPAGVLSDNGLCFSGKLRGIEVEFEARLRERGIRPFTGRPYHPQTTGKVERLQQTQKRWLAAQPEAANLAELQGQLDRFSRIYNYERPHQGIGRQTPISRWQASAPAQPATTALERPARRLRRLDGTVTTDGKLKVARNLEVQIGVEWEGHPGFVVIDGRRALVFVDGVLHRHLELDPGRRYYPSGKRRGGPRRDRLPC